MPSVISKPVPGNISATSRKTDFGLPFVETRPAADSFPVEKCDRILNEEGFRPMTAEERQDYARFLQD